MKNLKLTSTMLFALSVFFLVSCEFFSKENVNPQNNSGIIVKSAIQKLYESSFNGNSVIINGDTTVNYQEIKLHDKPTTTNINGLMNKGGSFKMVAIGGGITAGARDGGLHRNGQLTSFPNLIAIQMKVNFKQPLFDIKEANGFGYKVVSSITNGIPKYKSIGNNTALSKSSPIVELNPFVGENDNWGIPFSSGYDWRFDRDFTPSSYINFSNPFKTRLWTSARGQKNNAEYEILNKKFDFILIEPGIDSYVNGFISGATFSGGVNLSQLPQTTIVGYANTIGAKLVMSNIPSITDLPFMNIVDLNEVKKINQAEIFVKIRELPSDIISVPTGSVMLPSSIADSLLNPKISSSKKRGLSYKNPLSTKEIYTLDKLKTLLNDIDNQNKFIASGVKSYPIVDLNMLFKKIAKSELISDDGIRVNQKNFFSSDGIFPSAFGQAIIANEYIKTINSFYKTSIPLIQTANYINK